MRGRGGLGLGRGDAGAPWPSLLEVAGAVGCVVLGGLLLCNSLLVFVEMPRWDARERQQWTAALAGSGFRLLTAWALGWWAWQLLTRRRRAWRGTRRVRRRMCGRCGVALGQSHGVCAACGEAIPASYAELAAGLEEMVNGRPATRSVEREEVLPAVEPEPVEHAMPAPSVVERSCVAACAVLAGLYLVLPLVFFADGLMQGRKGLDDFIDLMGGLVCSWVVGVALAAGAWHVSTRRARAWRARPRVRRWVCGVCGYDLRGGHDTCPECGNRAVGSRR